MRAFASLTAAVLVVIGVGVAIGVLRQSSTIRTRTYSLAGRSFSVEFAGRLGPAQAPLLACMPTLAGTSDGDRLALLVTAIGPVESASGSCVTGNAGGYTSTFSCTRARAALQVAPGIRLRSGVACSASVVRKTGSFQFIVAATSTEGLSHAQAVVNSFKLLT
ncbi:MAG: hypothetical protein ACLPQS_04345 [Acidimicrobiales bacterium]